jgi:hypothetical protein
MVLAQLIHEIHGRLLLHELLGCFQGDAILESRERSIEQGLPTARCHQHSLKAKDIEGIRWKEVGNDV